MVRTGTYKYNNISSTKRVNHVKTFKNTPNIFKMYAADTLKTCIGTDYIFFTYPQKYTITGEPLAKQINCENTGNILG